MKNIFLLFRVLFVSIMSVYTLQTTISAYSTVPLTLNRFYDSAVSCFLYLLNK